MIKVNVKKNNDSDDITEFIIDGNVVTVNDSNGKLIRKVTTENESEKTTLRNIIYSNYDSYIQVLNID